MIHIPDETCPLKGPTNVEQNTLISEKLTNLSFTESTHMIALKTNGTYYNYVLASEGNYVQSEVKILTSNTFVLL